MMLTKKKAKEISIEVWQYLYDRPEIVRKENLPVELYSKIKNFQSECPLCEKFDRGDITCKGCPLNNCGIESVYKYWRNSENEIDRKYYAGEILNKIKNWKV